MVDTGTIYDHRLHFTLRSSLVLTSPVFQTVVSLHLFGVHYAEARYVIMNNFYVLSLLLVRFHGRLKRLLECRGA